MNKNRSPQTIIEGVQQSVAEFIGDEPPFDDLTAVCIEIKKPTGKRLVVDAKPENLSVVNDFVEDFLSDTGCSAKVKSQIDLAVEEIFINIASYAYEEGTGKADIFLSRKNDELHMTFKDSGTPYDPLQKPDPDTSLSASDRKIGGLGIFLVKKTMDDVSYEYRDGYNILSITKNLK
ncbi:MAG: ATP-binding protein [Ruminococcus sp.]|nr:ATP-binding protein [Ruminococcus sp.]